MRIGSDDELFKEQITVADDAVLAFPHTEP
jgi:hypothetical protein